MFRKNWKTKIVKQTFISVRHICYYFVFVLFWVFLANCACFFCPSLFYIKFSLPLFVILNQWWCLESTTTADIWDRGSATIFWVGGGLTRFGVVNQPRWVELMTKCVACSWAITTIVGVWRANDDVWGRVLTVIVRVEDQQLS